MIKEVYLRSLPSLKYHFGSFLQYHGCICVHPRTNHREKTKKHTEYKNYKCYNRKMWNLLRRNPDRRSSGLRVWQWSDLKLWVKKLGIIRGDLRWPGGIDGRRSVRGVVQLTPEPFLVAFVINGLSRTVNAHKKWPVRLGRLSMMRSSWKIFGYLWS